MAPAPQRKPDKPVIKREGFTIRDGVITCNGHGRVDGSRLEAMFHPDRLKVQRLQKAAENEAKRLFGRPFFAAQLRWHDITFPRSATEQQLKSLLDKAAAAKQCVNVPASVIRLHEELKHDYEKEVQAWEYLIANWEVELQRRQEEQWAQLETPSERAGYDLDRFMEHYFLTDGQPDPAKKPEPLALYGFTDDQVITELQVRAADVPGLEIAMGGQGPDRTLCIGWDRAGVLGLAAEIENIEIDRQRKKIQDEWEKAMQKHQNCVSQSRAQAQVQAEAPSLGATMEEGGNEGFSLRKCRGSFVVKCQAIGEMYPDPFGIFTVDISDSPAHNGETLRAAVNFGVFQGTAILSFNEPVLDWFARYYDRNALAAAGGDPNSAPLAASNGKRKADGEAEDEPSAKQRRLDGPHPASRVLVRMRGRNIVVDQVWPEIQSGYLDFTDATCTEFKGVFDIPGVAEDVEVEGFRVAKFAAVEPPSWNWFWPVDQHVSA
ncbi:hypothetical protein VP1G_03764 [Cytospora mali]|uniref:Uncharacterized protein n=1 Tax=Cytospora mali TaxID=578113 RepID=A0A194UXY4_CYTMA|nr:hypothetical protein VP1G_03764 [Valsa mali var. pyri (nom. inval.)]